MPVFKASNGNYYTRQLFWETSLDRSLVLYTLKSEEHESFPSLYKLYMDSVLQDPTEYAFAKAYFYGWEHWERLSETEWFKPYIEAWRREADIRLKATNLIVLQRVAKAGGRESVAAARYLIEKGWEPKDKQATKRGRPSKEEVKQELERQAAIINTSEDEARRLGLIN